MDDDVDNGERGALRGSMRGAIGGTAVADGLTERHVQAVLDELEWTSTERPS